MDVESSRHTDSNHGYLTGKERKINVGRVNGDHDGELEAPPNKKLKMSISSEEEDFPEGLAALNRRKAFVTPSQKLHYRDYSLKIVRSKGQYFWDKNDEKYLDTANSVSLVGHCNERVVQACSSQMSILNTNSRFLNDRIVTYAKHLCSKFPKKLSCCFFTNSGSEANDLALQIASVVTGQTHVVALEGGQYTDTDTAGKLYAEDLKKLVEGKPVGAFIHESILSCAGQVTLPRDYLSEVYRYIHSVGGLCIADEIQTGFGRMGDHFWAFESHGVCPDIVTLGKPMGNGHPVSGVVTTQEIADKFAACGMEYFNTFGGNPVSMAVAEAVLCVVEDENLQDHAKEMGDYLRDRLVAIKEKHPCIGDVRGSGLCLGVDFVKDPESREPDSNLAHSVQKDMLSSHQIIVVVDGMYNNVIRIQPPMVVTREDCKSIVRALDDVLTKLQEDS